MRRPRTVLVAKNGFSAYSASASSYRKNSKKPPSGTWAKAPAIGSASKASAVRLGVPRARYVARARQCAEPGAHGAVCTRFGNGSCGCFFVGCNVTRYSGPVIKSFRHKGLQAFFEQGTKAGIPAAHSPKLARQLARLENAQAPHDMNLPGWGLRMLHGNLSGHWFVAVNGNWRMTFMFEGVNVVLVDYQDYH